MLEDRLSVWSELLMRCLEWIFVEYSEWIISGLFVVTVSWVFVGIVNGSLVSIVGGLKYYYSIVVIVIELWFYGDFRVCKGMKYIYIFIYSTITTLPTLDEYVYWATFICILIVSELNSPQLAIVSNLRQIKLVIPSWNQYNPRQLVWPARYLLKSTFATLPISPSSDSTCDHHLWTHMYPSPLTPHVTITSEPTRDIPKKSQQLKLYNIYIILTHTHPSVYYGVLRLSLEYLID